MTTRPDPATRTGGPAPFPPGHPDGPPAHLAPAVLPPGMVWGLAADGTRIPAYALPDTDTPDGQAPIPAPVAQPIPSWAKTAALLMFAASGSTALAAWGLSTAAESLAAIARALWALAVIAAVVAFVVVGVVIAFKRPTGGRTSNHATATSTATGRSILGGKVTATATAHATSKRR